MDAKDHIWLRQSVTMTIDGQTRTLEVGIPLPPNATAQEIESLLRVADLGMQGISRHLDAHIAQALTGDYTSASAVIETSSARGIPPQPSDMSHDAASPNGRAPMDATSEPITTDETPETGDEVPAHDAAVRPQPSISQTPAAAKAAPARPTASGPTAESASAPHRPTTPPTAPAARPSSPRPASASDAGGEMTRPQFIAATNELGLNPRQAMDHLGVRSLEGLNLREALESLRRQLLGAASPEPEIEPKIEPKIESAPTPRTTSSPAAAAAPRYFEEEDDETILYAMDEDDELIEDELVSHGDATANGGAPDTQDAFDEVVDLDDVPDLTPPPATRQRSAPATRQPAATMRETPTPASAPASEPVSTGGARSHAMQLIGKLRAATGGGPASDYQRNAYHNIVEEELGKAQAVALVRGLWRTTADRLSAGQLEALIRWGKEEVFAEEAAQVLATLRAEQRRSDQGAAKSATEPAEPRPTTRGRPAGGPR